MRRLEDRGDREDVAARVRHQDMPAGDKDSVQAGPPVGDDRGTASRGFKQPDARRIAHAEHVCAGDVERETLSRVKPSVPIGPKMLYSVKIGGPGQFGWIEGPRDRKSPGRPMAGGLTHQGVELWLPVGAVGSEISQIPCGFSRGRSMAIRIDRAIEHTSCTSAVPALEEFQSRTASEGKIEVERGDQRRIYIGAVAGSETGERDRRVDVVESNDAVAIELTSLMTAIPSGT